MRVLLCCLMFLSVSSAGFAAPEANLIKNGDFEAPFATIADIAGSWMIWGPAEGKIPANFTRDTVNPHGGQACLRIYRPANPGSWFGLPVTSPTANAVHPKKKTKLTVSFWARAEAPGEASLGLFSYRGVDPLVDGPGVGSFRFQAGPEWKEHTFSVTEGLDFFAEDARFIYLAFFITTRYTEPRTMWIDDVAVRESPVAATGLVNAATIPYEPIPLRLKPGADLAVTVSARQRLHRANKLVGGVSMLSLGRWTGYPFNKAGEYSLTPEMEAELRDLKLPLTRFYGVVEQEPFTKLEDAMDRIAFFLGKAGIPQETTMIELEDYFANSVIAPEEWARTVRYCLSKGYRFRYWEVGNETYMGGAWGSAKSGKAFPTPDDYAKHVQAVSAAIRAVQPDAKIGLSLAPEHAKWGNYLLAATRGSYDFVCPHWYGGGSLDDFEEITLGENMGKLNKARKLNALLKAYNPGRDVYQYDSEWGLHSMPKDGKPADLEPRNANIIGTMYRAVRLIYYAREEVVRGASSWKSYSGTHEPGFGVLFRDAPGKRSMLYWLYYYFNRGLGDWVVGLDGTAPFYTCAKMKTGHESMPAVPATPVTATVSDDGKTLYLMAANASWANATTASLSLRDFRVHSAEGVVLSHGDRNAHPLLERKEDFVSPLALEKSADTLRFTLPAHSIVFITVR